MSDRSADEITIRPFTPSDDEFLARISHRLIPTSTTSPRDPGAFAAFFADLDASGLLSESGSVAFVGLSGDEPVGVVALHPDTDYFTGHPRAYVDILVVAEAAEGKGVGRALLSHVEQWARDRGFREVVLDVFAGNQRAIAFYERVGYAVDHLRLAKPLD